MLRSRGGVTAIIFCSQSDGFITRLFIYNYTQSITFGTICYRQSLKRGSSRWDQETPQKYQRIEESAELDLTTSDPLQGGKGELLSSDNCQPILPRTGEWDNATLVK